MPARVSAKTRQLRLGRSLSARSAMIARLATMEHLAAVRQTMALMREEELARRSISGSPTQNSMQSRMRRALVSLWTVAPLLLLTLPVWIVLAQSFNQESSRWLLCDRPPSLQSGGLSTSEGLKLSFRSAELDILKLNPRSKEHETVQNHRDR